MDKNWKERRTNLPIQEFLLQLFFSKLPFSLGKGICLNLSQTLVKMEELIFKKHRK